jgi:hypothetical protein
VQNDKQFIVLTYVSEVSLRNLHISFGSDLGAAALNRTTRIGLRRSVFQCIPIILLDPILTKLAGVYLIHYNVQTIE